MTSTFGRLPQDTRMCRKKLTDRRVRVPEVTQMTSRYAPVPTEAD